MGVFSFRVPEGEHSYPLRDDRDWGASGPLVAFKPPVLDPATLVGRTIEAWTSSAGTYGMGGPGFVGFRLGGEWLIVAIWGAASWLSLDGRPLEDDFWEERGRQRPLLADLPAGSEELFVGWQVTAFSVERRSLTMGFAGGRRLELLPDPQDRPTFQGSGERRQLGPEEDLRQLVFLSPTTELWI
jgi:hypothetical protein